MRFIWLSLIFVSFGASAAISPQQKLGLDRYLQDAVSASAAGSVRKSMGDRVADLDRRLSLYVADLQRMNPPLQQRLALVQDSLKLYQSSELNLYNDSSWREYLVKSTTPYCCDQWRIGKSPKNAGSSTQEYAEMRAREKAERRAARLAERARQGRGKSPSTDGPPVDGQGRPRRVRDDSAPADSGTSPAGERRRGRRDNDQ